MSKEGYSKHLSQQYFFKYDFGGTGWYNSYTLFNTFGGAIQILSMMALYPLLRNVLKLNSIKIFLFLSLLNVFISFLSALSSLNVFLYFITLVLYFYFLVYIVVLIFSYYDREFS